MGRIDESKSVVMANLRRVVEFAKANGFPGAEMAGWISGEPDGALEPGCFADGLEGGGIRSIRLGLYLHGSVHLTQHYVEEADEYRTIAHDDKDAAEQAIAPLFTGKSMNHAAALAASPPSAVSGSGPKRRPGNMVQARGLGFPELSGAPRRRQDTKGHKERQDQ